MTRSESVSGLHSCIEQNASPADEEVAKHLPLSECTRCA